MLIMVSIPTNRTPQNGYKMDSSIVEMYSERNSVFTVYLTLITLTIGVIGAPPKIEDCDEPIHLGDTECCTKYSYLSVEEPLLFEDCVKILINSKVSSYQSLEGSLECFFECLATNVELLDEHKKIMYDEILKNITKDLKPDYTTSSINNIKNCVEKDYVTKKSSKCQSGSLQLFLCVHREQILNCPAEYWRNSDECNNYKSVLEKCPKTTPIFQLFESRVT